MSSIKRASARAYAEGVCAVGLLLILSAWGVTVLEAQVLPDAALSFDVASVRPTITSGGLDLAGVRLLRGGSVIAPNASLRTLIAFAYGLDLMYERIEADSDLLDKRFDVMAKTRADVQSTRFPDIGPVNLMMQTLLTERFKLRVRVGESRQPGYALVAVSADGSLGTGIRPSDRDCSDPAGARSGLAGATQVCSDVVMDNELRANAADMADLARLLGLQLRQHVVDRTGISGSFDVRMRFDQLGTAQFAGLPVVASEGSTTSLPSLFTALREQLGLKLEPARIPARVLIIEHIEPPTPN